MASPTWPTLPTDFLHIGEANKPMIKDLAGLASRPTATD